MSARVLLYVHYPSHVRVMTRVAEALRASGRFDPLFYFDTPAVAGRFAPACVALGFCTEPEVAPVLDANGGVVGQGPVTGALGPWLWRTITSGVQRIPEGARTLGGDVLSTALAPAAFSWAVVRNARGLRRSRTRLARLGIEAVIMPGDSVSYETPWLIRAAHERAAPALIVPFTVSGPTELVVDLGRHRAFDQARPLNRALARRAPRWSYRHGGRDLVRLPAPEAAAIELLDLAPPDPWTLHSGYADRIAVESEYMRAHYLRLGFPPAQLAMSGAITDDLAARARGGGRAHSDALVEEAGLPTGRRLAVFTMSEFSGFFQKGRAAGFSSRDDLVRFWLDTFSEMAGWNILISLHPFIDEATYPPIRRDNVAVSRRPIEELIGGCELFISSISATVRTAIACGVPVVDHDPFAFRYPNFVGLEGVSIVEERAPFREALLGMALDSARYERAARAQRAIAPRFGQLDGMAAARLVGLLDELVAERQRGR